MEKIGHVNVFKIMVSAVSASQETPEFMWGSLVKCMFPLMLEEMSFSKYLCTSTLAYVLLYGSVSSRG